jgi:Epoxide hydrolase N terminus
LDWRRQEAELNRLAHYHSEIDGLRIHFLHERGKGPGAAADRALTNPSFMDNVVCQAEAIKTQGMATAG